MKISPDKIVLNNEQIKAITHKKGPLLIIAGAGTGKTTVITERIKWLISEKLAKPQEILALTFTEKAAREMEDRVDRALPYGITQMFITTFHSFGDRVLRQEAVSIGLDPGFRLLTEAESIIFFRQNLFQFELDYYRPLGNPNKFIVAILTHFNRLKDEDISSDEYLHWAKSVNSGKDPDNYKYLELAVAYKKFEELKIKEGVMDFSDLISNTLLIMRRRKNILKEYQQRFRYVLVDEFQDTNFAQNELAMLLAGVKADITATGDDDQAIYRWRGAAVSNIIQFRKRYKKAEIIVLKKNYRSTQTILDSVYRLIQKNNPDRLEVKEKINKKLISVRGIQGEPPEFIFKNRVEDEAESIARKIVQIKKQAEIQESDDKKYKWSDFAVLVRANQHSVPFTSAFRRLNIPFQFLGPGMLFRQKEVKELLAYIKFLANPDDSVALFSVLSLPVFDISVRDLSALLNFSKKTGRTLYEALDIFTADIGKKMDHWSKKLNYQPYLPYLSDRSAGILLKIAAMIEDHLKSAKTDSAGQILYSFLEKSGMLQKFTDYQSIKEEKEISNISKFFDKLKGFEAEHEDATVYAVSDWLDMSMELGESPQATDTDWIKNDAVNILTVHSSKGLEFPVVYLVNLVSDRFPTRERTEKIPIPDELIKEILPVGDFHQQEERRLFYVGATRARDMLFLTAALYYGEGKRVKKISPFVYEILGKNDLPGIEIESGNNEQLTLLAWKKQDLKEEEPKRQNVNYLSYSQISTFLTCPLQYKYRHILKIPVPSSAAASFGSSVHLALQNFYQLYRKSLNPDKNTLLNLLHRVWIPLGYKNKKYEAVMKKRAEGMLSLYYDKGHSSDVKIDDLEKLFTIKLTPSLKLGGKIDRVDKLNSNSIEIIDYKTGKILSDKDIAGNLQMTVYALAASDRGIYNTDPENVTLSFYFLEESRKISSKREKQQLVEAKTKIVNIAGDIEKSQFFPKVGPWCDFCDFRLICEAWQ
ncbi:hypothetical protein A3D05_05270 [Candidatus Gottesmanbacteria bacterium RIFCSPHIGHO2_02_FULL_40_24]|uniref:DNA 3'-5' helicase n=1 Tax=Candidatus Gottesmanbacteria bacterium RIFCSPHIGHO2_01_FULL_40_15 TaxID=1798376 RepID=A0A1F5Z6R4_9BACT|nr:MAG: hypothetical protein A2777_01905 [Candidatus Gottesmanbacteria bacterium RIFCSPHIGHO2_01_FULL_40_15]OGG16442.1 MAG: hypothetical protein A3D05_05270 [Candidatus Gottesmanbacteria bacterium RIFCSPHIGHO2_02_FULL_40_24]OGG22723.1 MAG: hypothetical protein A3B48_02900 [Candidatus Gottesmanbacteria bacterium RIFCSPLOWO2_01_FULL_40_10]OGG25556.1 MAG: hypothetical protein A3E42_04420 [Candidatus Gottesmanbacteria bacterium RIFCSPHIGHO2_12_FULL_40_13]OGG32563.1 MAG: hypothetical protein A3I80_0